jgi:5-methylcytosine-specific restriction enzyme A
MRLHSLGQKPMVNGWKYKKDNGRLTGRAAVVRRQRFLEAQPLCAHCEARGFVIAAVEVDHIVPLFKGGADDIENMQGLCRPCHDKKTRDDLGWSMSKECDVNGLPKDPRHHWNR